MRHRLLPGGLLLSLGICACGGDDSGGGEPCDEIDDPYDCPAMGAWSSIPFDAFSSTPDYTPFEYDPRVHDMPCNPGGTRAAKEAQSWDMSEPDEQPGIARWTWKILHDHTYE